MKKTYTAENFPSLRETNTLEFQDFLKQTDKKLSILYFYSDDCPPCEAFMPIINDIAEHTKDELTVSVINRQDNRDYAISLNITSSPTAIVFFDGEPILDKYINPSVSDMDAEAVCSLISDYISPDLKESLSKYTKAKYQKTNKKVCCEGGSCSL